MIRKTGDYPRDCLARRAQSAGRFFENDKLRGHNRSISCLISVPRYAPFDSSGSSSRGGTNANAFLRFTLSSQAVWVFSLIDYEPPTYHNGDYMYPWWAEAIGWGIASLSLICIPAFAVYVFVRADGVTFAEVC